MKGTHVLPVSTCVRNFVALIVLMVLTIVAAEVDFGGHVFGMGTAGATLMNNMVAMAIAVSKAMLVILFFMGVKYNTRLVQVWVCAGFVWMLLLMITYGDYSTRHPVEGWTPSRETILGVKEFPAPINEDFKIPPESEGH